MDVKNAVHALETGYSQIFRNVNPTVVVEYLSINSTWRVRVWTQGDELAAAFEGKAGSLELAIAGAVAELLHSLCAKSVNQIYIDRLAEVLYEATCGKRKA